MKSFTKTKNLLVEFNRKGHICYNALATQNTLEKGLMIAETQLIFPSNLSVVRCYFANDEIYYFCTNGYVYTLQNGKAVKAIEEAFTSEPKCFEAKLSDGKATFFYDGNYLYFLNGKKVKTPSFTGENSTLIYNRIFTSKDQTVYCSNDLILDDLDEELNFDVVLEAPYELGKVVGVGYIDRSLIIACKNGVLRLDNFLNGRDIICTKIASGYVDLKDKSVVTIGNFTYCLGRDGVYEISKTKVEKKADFNENLPCEFLFYGSYENYYIALVKTPKVLNVNLMHYNVSTGQIEYSYCDDTLSALGGYAADKYVGFVRKLTLNKCLPGLPFYWHSGRLYLENGLKRLISVEFDAHPPLDLIVKGEFGMVKTILEEWEPSCKCNLASNWFEFQLSSEWTDAKVEKMRIKYKV